MAPFLSHPWSDTNNWTGSLARMGLKARGQYCRRLGTEKLFKMGLTFLFKDKTRPLSADIRSQLLSLDGNMLVRGTLACHQNDLWGSLREGKQKSNSSTFFFPFSAAKESQMHSTVFRIQKSTSLRALGSSPESSIREISSQWRCAGHRGWEKTVLICTVLGERVLHHLEKAHWVCKVDLPGISGGLRLTNLQHHPGSDGDGGGWWWYGIGDLMVVIMWEQWWCRRWWYRGDCDDGGDYGGKDDNDSDVVVVIMNIKWQWL